MGDLLKGFLSYATSCLAQCPIVVVGSGRLGVLLGVVAACCRHSAREVVRYAASERKSCLLSRQRHLEPSCVPSLFRRSAAQFITALRDLAGPKGGAFAATVAAAFSEAGRVQTY